MIEQTLPDNAQTICDTLQELPDCIGVALLDQKGALLERKGRIAEWFVEKMNRILANRGETIPTGAIALFHAPPEIAVLLVEEEFIAIAECRGKATFGTIQLELERRLGEYLTR